MPRVGDVHVEGPYCQEVPKPHLCNPSLLGLHQCPVPCPTQVQCHSCCPVDEPRGGESYVQSLSNNSGFH
ncbi:hypothetical protein Taro_011673 [Colocasia esculenta]|uniref:Uncharacterized protein n=1 Tax=Colocasia esculenta TaxID=4460 RepID=A0A843UBB5_COLES|nr:hypothetical protein [Colocasia esculenta]